MTIAHDEIRIDEPCPVAGDDARSADGVRSWHCEHCDKAVHVLSNMTEQEARELLSTRDDVCVTYTVDDDGSIRFAPERARSIVPIGALTRRMTVAASVGLGVALAACTPHDNASVARPAIYLADTPEGPRTVATVVPEMPPTAATAPASTADEPCPPSSGTKPVPPLVRRTGGRPVPRNWRR